MCSSQETVRPLRAAMTTAVRFPWPEGTRGSAVVAEQVQADYRRSILLAAPDGTSEFTARSASRALRKRAAEGALNRSPVPVLVVR